MLGMHPEHRSNLIHQKENTALFLTLSNIIFFLMTLAEYGIIFLPDQICPFAWGQNQNRAAIGRAHCDLETGKSDRELKNLTT